MGPGSAAGEVRWWSQTRATQQASLPLVGRDRGWGWSPLGGEPISLPRTNRASTRRSPPQPPIFPGIDPGPIASFSGSGAIRRPRLCGRGSPVEELAPCQPAGIPPPCGEGLRVGVGRPHADIDREPISLPRTHRASRRRSPPQPPIFPGPDPGPIASFSGSGDIRGPRLCGRGSPVVELDPCHPAGTFSRVGRGPGTRSRPIHPHLAPRGERSAEGRVRGGQGRGAIVATLGFPTRRRGPYPRRITQT